MKSPACCYASPVASRSTRTPWPSTSLSRWGREGNYLAEHHTAQNFRREHFLPKLLPRDVRQTWEQKGAKTTLDLARDRVRAILAKHQPRVLDPAVERELQAYVAMVRERTVADYYAAEWEG